MKNVEEYNVESKTGVVLNANESFYQMDEDMMQKVVSALQNVPLERYPDSNSSTLCEAYATYCGVDASQLMAGNGSDELLGMMISLSIQKGDCLLTLSPDFSMYDYYVSMNNGQMLRYQSGAEDIFDVDAFIVMAKQEKVRLILFSNPNNPTGKVVSESDLLKLIESVPDKTIIIDEAYADFYTSSMVKYVETYKNLYVTRTLSKAFGLAGIRCGFLVASKANMKRLYTYKVPYNVNSVSQCIATCVLQDTDGNEKKIQSIVQLRDEMYEQYKKIDAKNIILYPSHANYLYGKSTCKDAFISALEKKQIHIRNYADAHFRITIGNAQQNESVLEVIRELEEKYENSKCK